MSLLSVSDLDFSYRAPVLRRVTFDVGPHELIAVVGPNGAGKSTLLKVLVGILRTSKGRVHVEGCDLHSMSRREVAMRIGYVPQQSAAQFPLTALEFVLQGRFAQGRLIGFETDEDVREARRAMEMTESDEFSCRPVAELSGGERQRVMLARALASRPRLLVLDEPVANLDIAHQLRMFELLRRLVAEREASAIVVTHELNLAAEFATSVLILKSGEMVAFGPPPEVMTESRLESVFDSQLLVDVNPVTGAPRITPLPVVRVDSRQ